MGQQGSWARSVSGPSEGGGEAGDGGEELRGVDAGDAVELFAEAAADGGLVLPGSVLDHGDVVAPEADAQFGVAQGVRKDADGVVAEGFFDDVERPGLERFGHQLFAPEPFTEGRGHELHFVGGDGVGHLAARPAEEYRCGGNADVRAPSSRRTGSPEFPGSGMTDIPSRPGHDRPRYTAKSHDRGAAYIHVSQTHMRMFPSRSWWLVVGAALFLAACRHDWRGADDFARQIRCGMTPNDIRNLANKSGLPADRVWQGASPNIVVIKPYALDFIHVLLQGDKAVALQRGNHVSFTTEMEYGSIQMLCGAPQLPDRDFWEYDQRTASTPGTSP